MNVFMFHSFNENNYFYIEKGKGVERKYVGSLNIIIVSDFQKHEKLKGASWKRQIPGCQFLVSFPVKYNEAWVPGPLASEVTVWGPLVEICLKTLF